MLSADNRFRIDFFRRSDGTFGYLELTNCGNQENPTWTRYSSTSSRFASLEIAKTEALGRVAWLKKEVEWTARDHETMLVSTYLEKLD